VSFRQSLRGTYWRLDSPEEELALELNFEACFEDVRDHASPKTWALRGSIMADGLASRRDVRGSISPRLFDHGRVFYRMGFMGDDGVPYQICAQQEWSGLAPLDSLTKVDGSLEDGSGTECARLRLRFDPSRAALRFLGTLRVRWVGGMARSRL
jgi:hypothetical protein